MVDKYKQAVKYYLDEKDYKKAYSLFLELAEEGDLKAQGMLGSIFTQDDNVEKNIEKADYWYKQASLQGDLYSMHVYAYFCLDNKNKDKADFLFYKMIEKEYIPAIYSMANFYKIGEFNYEINKEKALTLYKKACNLNDNKSCIEAFRLEKELNGDKKAVIFFMNKIGFWKFLKMCCSKFFTRYND